VIGPATVLCCGKSGCANLNITISLIRNSHQAIIMQLVRSRLILSPHYLSLSGISPLETISHLRLFMSLFAIRVFSECDCGGHIEY